MTPLTKHWVTSNIGTSFRVGLNHTVLDHGTALYLAADVEACLTEACAALDSASQYINGWTGCVPEEDARSKQWRAWKEVNAVVNAALDRLKGTP